MRLFPQFALHEFKEEQPLWTYYLSFDKGKNKSKLFSLSCPHFKRDTIEENHYLIQ